MSNDIMGLCLEKIESDTKVQALDSDNAFLKEKIVELNHKIETLVIVNNGLREEIEFLKNKLTLVDPTK